MDPSDSFNSPKKRCLYISVQRYELPLPKSESTPAAVFANIN